MHSYSGGMPLECFITVIRPYTFVGEAREVTSGRRLLEIRKKSHKPEPQSRGSDEEIYKRLLPLYSVVNLGQPVQAEKKSWMKVGDRKNEWEPTKTHQNP